MNMKMKALVVATAMAIGSQAQAEIDKYNTQNGELFFSLYDSAAKVSFSMDLAPVSSDASMGTFNLDNFLPTGKPAGAGTTNAPGYVLTPGKSFTWHIDSTNTAFSQYLASANLAGSKWSVVAGDSVGAVLAADGLRYLSTSKDPATTVDNTTTQNLGAFGATDVYVSALNVAHQGVPDVTAYHVAADGDAYVGQGLTENFKGKAAFNTMALVGESQSFYYITGKPANNVAVTQFANASGNATWTFAAATGGGYDLTYQAPVPVPAAVWLLGSALVGLVGVARRQQKAA